TASDGTPSNSQSYNPSLAIDGAGHRYVAFESRADTLVAGDTNQSWDIFVKDLSSNVTTRVSTDSNGGEANFHSACASLAVDGSGHVFVAFENIAGHLTANDSNGYSNVFLKNVSSNATSLISRRDPSVPVFAGGGVASRVAISRDGRYVAFASSAAN